MSYLRRVWETRSSAGLNLVLFTVTLVLILGGACDDDIIEQGWLPSQPFPFSLGGGSSY